LPTADELLADPIRAALTAAGLVAPADGPDAVRFVDDPRPALLEAAGPAPEQALPRPARETATPSVHIHLGRVEVVQRAAVAKAAPARPARTPRPPAGPDHDAYLARRRDRR
jgi:hypothetical protein